MMHLSNLLKKHQLSDIKASDSKGNTILHLAIKNEELTPQEKIAVFDILLDKAVNLNTKNQNGETGLHLAIVSREKDLIDFLLTHKVHIDDTITEYLIKDENEKFNKLFDTDFKISDSEMQKLENYSINFLEWIMSKGLLNVDTVNRYGQSVLILAMNFNLQHLLPTLLKYTTAINYENPKTKSTLLHLFLENNTTLRTKHTSPVDIFQLNRKRLYPGYIERNAAHVVKIMLEKGVSLEAVDEIGNTALHVAITKEENIRIVEMLISHSKDVNHKNLEGETPFCILFNKWLQSKSLQIDYNSKILSSLIAKGANVHEINKYGMSPLCTATETHNLTLVGFLKENGANYNVINNEGETLLHLLAKKRSSFTNVANEETMKLVDLLISQGCNVNARDKNGNTALHVAAQQCDVIIAEKLIKHGAQIDCKNNRGETSLCFYVDVYNQQKALDDVSKDLDEEAMLAEINLLADSVYDSNDQIHSYIKMLELLLKNGADFNTKFDNGHSILHMALWENYNSYKRLDEVLTNLTEYLSVEINGKVKHLLNHWIKLEVANLRCDPGFEYADLIKEEEYNKIDEKCQNEIKLLKDTFVDSRTTLYTLLHMDLNSRRAYINNENLQKILQSPKLEEEFPEYSVLIFSCYRETLTRKSLMEPAKKTWLELTKIKLPEICIELIFCFLSNAELLEFIEENEYYT